MPPEFLSGALRAEEHRSPTSNMTGMARMRCSKGHEWTADPWGQNPPMSVSFDWWGTQINGLCPICLGEVYRKLFAEVGRVEEAKG